MDISIFGDGSMVNDDDFVGRDDKSGRIGSELINFRISVRAVIYCSEILGGGLIVTEFV